MYRKYNDYFQQVIENNYLVNKSWLYKKWSRSVFWLIFLRMSLRVSCKWQCEMAIYKMKKTGRKIKKQHFVKPNYKRKWISIFTCCSVALHSENLQVEENLREFWFIFLTQGSFDFFKIFLEVFKNLKIFFCYI